MKSKEELKEGYYYRKFQNYIKFQTWIKENLKVGDIILARPELKNGTSKIWRTGIVSEINKFGCIGLFKFNRKEQMFQVCDGYIKTINSEISPIYKPKKAKGEAC